MLFYPTAIALSPNAQADDVFLSLKKLFTPWKWRKGRQISQVEEWFEEKYSSPHVFLFNSGRSALYFLLSNLGIGNGDEVIIQAFTCVAVPNAVIWTGAKAVFADIDDSLNIDVSQIERKITKNTKAIIIQHTFGIPADTAGIKSIAEKNNILLIEDCAHCLGMEIEGTAAGKFSDASFFSFGRDKVLSSVFGGLLLINSDSKIDTDKLKTKYKQVDLPGNFWIFQQLMHPIIFYLALPFYRIYIGKLLIYLMQKLKIVSKPIFSKEKEGEKPSVYPGKYPNALADILLNQLTKLKKYNEKRRLTAEYYFSKLKGRNMKLPVRSKSGIYLRFNIFVKNSEEIILSAKRRGILLGNWYKNIVDPRGVDYKKIGYIKGSCKRAEEASSQSVNLPTHPLLSPKDRKKVVDIFTDL